MRIPLPSAGCASTPVEYGFILRYPKEAEDVTEITYEPWHWRYVGPENAALISAERPVL